MEEEFMKTRREHNIYCESHGVTPKICDQTNKWMDAPAKKGGGCAHRKERHHLIDCIRYSLSAKNKREAKERYEACQIHREADRKTDRCGSKSLR